MNLRYHKKNLTKKKPKKLKIKILGFLSIFKSSFISFALTKKYEVNIHPIILTYASLCDCKNEVLFFIV
jgi:hypothetical protein